MRYLNVDTAKKISKIGLGTWQFGSQEWGYGEQYSRQVAQSIVRRALELEVTLFYTAEIYGLGAVSEFWAAPSVRTLSRSFLRRRYSKLCLVAW